MYLFVLVLVTWLFKQVLHLFELSTFVLEPVGVAIGGSLHFLLVCVVSTHSSNMTSKTIDLLDYVPGIGNEIT